MLAEEIVMFRIKRNQDRWNPVGAAANVGGDTPVVGSVLPHGTPPTWPDIEPGNLVVGSGVSQLSILLIGDAVRTVDTRRRPVGLGRWMPRGRVAVAAFQNPWMLAAMAQEVPAPQPNAKEEKKKECTGNCENKSITLILASGVNSKGGNTGAVAKAAQAALVAMAELVVSELAAENCSSGCSTDPPCFCRSASLKTVGGGSSGTKGKNGTIPETTDEIDAAVKDIIAVHHSATDKGEYGKGYASRSVKVAVNRVAKKKYGRELIPPQGYSERSADTDESGTRNAGIAVSPKHLKELGADAKAAKRMMSINFTRLLNHMKGEQGGGWSFDLDGTSANVFVWVSITLICGPGKCEA